MVDPNDLEIGGWDISKLNLYDATIRAKVIEPDLIRQLKDDLAKITPLPACLNPKFIASNQADRADNVLTGSVRE